MDMNITSAAVLSQNNALRVAALNPQPAGNAAGQVSAPASSFASLLAAAANGAQPASAPAPAPTPALTGARASWLTDAKSALAARPSVKQFTDETGLDSATAKELVTGVVGSNSDTRNWKAIMASDDPVAAARAATAEMFNHADPARRPTASTGINSVLARSGNFVLIGSPGRSAGNASIGIVDASGKLLRNIGNSAESIARGAWMYGLDTNMLSNLQFSAERISPKLGAAVAQAQDAQPTSFLNASAYLAALQKSTQIT